MSVPVATNHVKSDMRECRLMMNAGTIKKLLHVWMKDKHRVCSDSHRQDFTQTLSAQESRFRTPSAQLKCKQESDNIQNAQILKTDLQRQGPGPSGAPRINVGFGNLTDVSDVQY